MDLANILMGVGIFLIILSFIIKDRTKKIEQDVEELSINLYQEMNSLKRRLKMVEEELMFESTVQYKAKTPISPTQTDIGSTKAGKPIHSILISQVIELNKQGLSIEEISQRSTLTSEQIHSILTGGSR